ncbi:MAG: rhodanese-like domain-containing protein [Pirellulales bacterium]
MTNDDLPLEISVSEVKCLLDEQADFVLLDCREQGEWDLVKIDGAQLLPMSEMQARVAELLPHAEDHVVVYCHHGMRSLQCQSMAGGIDAWSSRIDGSLPRYG